MLEMLEPPMRGMIATRVASDLGSTLWAEMVETLVLVLLLRLVLSLRLLMLLLVVLLLLLVVVIVVGVTTTRGLFSVGSSTSLVSGEQLGL